VSDNLDIGEILSDIIVAYREKNMALCSERLVQVIELMKHPSISVPKIKLIDRNHPTHLWSLRVPRCCMKTQSCGTMYFDTGKNRCARFAMFNVDGLNFCRQHAGSYLLDKAVRANGIDYGRDG
jgi:hypothetical protein